MDNVFSQRLKQLREEKGLSYQKLGDALGVSGVSLGYYERGERVPDIHTLAKMCKYFCVSSDYLIGLKNCRKDENAAAVVQLGLSEGAVMVLNLNHELDQEYACSIYSEVLSNLIEKSHEDPGEWEDDDENENIDEDEIKEYKLQHQKEKEAYIRCRHGADVLSALGQYYLVHASYEDDFFAISVHKGKTIKKKSTIDIFKNLNHPLLFNSKEMLEKMLIDKLIDTIKQGAREFANEHPELRRQEESNADN